MAERRLQAASRPRKGMIPPAGFPKTVIWLFPARERTPGARGGVMPRKLPALPNLQYLRKQAKELLDARQPHHPGWKLADAQHALAPEYGFESWPKLKAHVESLAVALNPFVGTWRADVARSDRHPENLFRQAMLEFSVARDTVTIAHDAIDGSGRPDRGTNTLECDGVERSNEHGYRMTARWNGAHRIEITSTFAGLEQRLATYEVSADARTMLITALQQRHVLDRV
jgi:hypothetical protein